MASSGRWCDYQINSKICANNYCSLITIRNNYILQMQNNQLTNRPRAHLFSRIPARIHASTSKNNSSRYLTLSKDLSKAQGIRLDRKTRISMDKLYEDSAFSANKKELQTRHSSSTTTMTGPWSHKSQSSSSHNLSSLSVSRTFREHQTSSQQRPTYRRVDILSTYYGEQESDVLTNGSKFEGIASNKGRPGGFKAYDIRGLVRYE